MILAQNGIKKSYKLTCKFAYHPNIELIQVLNIHRILREGA